MTGNSSKKQAGEVQHSGFISVAAAAAAAVNVVVIVFFILSQSNSLKGDEEGKELATAGTKTK